MREDASRIAIVQQLQGFPGIVRGKHAPLLEGVSPTAQA